MQKLIKQSSVSLCQRISQWKFYIFYPYEFRLLRPPPVHFAQKMNTLTNLINFLQKLKNSLSIFMSNKLFHAIPPLLSPVQRAVYLASLFD